LVTHTHPDFYDHVPTHEEILNVFQHTFLDLEKIMKGHDMVIAYHGASSESQVLFRICRHNKIPFLSIVNGRIGPLLNFQKGASDNNTILINRWNKLVNGIDKSSPDAIKFSQKTYEKLAYESVTTVPYDSYKNYFSKNKIINFKNIIKLINNLIKKRPLQNDYVSRRTLIKRNILFKIREIACKKYFLKKIPNYPFALYPLQFEPEASTLVVGQKNLDVIGVIKKFSYQLPSTWKLFVKEHGVMVGKRPINFYKQLKEIYNVEIIDPSLNSIDLIKNSETVIVNTSTMGLEAAILGKKVICLGNPYYSFISSIIKPSNINDIDHIISEPWLESDRNKCKKELKLCLEVLYDSSMKYDHSNTWNSNPDKDKFKIFNNDFYFQFKKDVMELYGIIFK